MLDTVLIQFNPTMGDLKNNYRRIAEAYRKYGRKDLVIFPELAICGYFPEDMLLNQYFIETCQYYMQKLAQEVGENYLIIGAPWQENGCLYNAALVLHKGKVQDIIKKCHLPNYGIFNEKRVFISALAQKIVDIHGYKVGILICEDTWHRDVATEYTQQGAELLISVNASPFEKRKPQERLDVVKEIVSLTGLPTAYLNTFGAQDGVIFDGHSFLVTQDNTIAFQSDLWNQDSISFQFNGQDIICSPYKQTAYDAQEDIYQAIALGLKEYVRKNNFSQVVLGLSGGIDSALVAVIAADALGAKNIHCVALPSTFSSSESLYDAKELIHNIDCTFDTLSIKDLYQGALSTLEPLFKNDDIGITEENLQSRMRGVLLMAISNKLGKLLLTTSNKSELAVGFGTLYGDMCGAYAPIKDVYKTEVYELANWRNRHIPTSSKLMKKNIIPVNIIEKEPSAELKPEQRDGDCLPPYKLLDNILYGLIEEDKGVPEIAGQYKYSVELVAEIEDLLYNAEFKRRQSAPGPKISRRPLGLERRYPITNRFRNSGYKDAGALGNHIAVATK